MKSIKKLSIVLIVAVFVLFIFICSIQSANKVNMMAHAMEECYTEYPVISILNHGLGGSPIDWTNNNHFKDNNGYDDLTGGYSNPSQIIYNYYSSSHYDDLRFYYRGDSIIEQLRNIYGENNALVYVITPNSNNDPYVDKFTYSSANEATHYSAESVSLSNMDFSKHSIIVYNSENDFDDDTATVYNRFKIAIDKIAVAYHNANNIYPKMNLIGHSRGTIINIKYATDYPDRIDSMFALGGIFDSPALAQTLESNLVTNVLNLLSGNLVETIQNMHDSEFIKDIALVNGGNYFTSLKNDWNTATVGKNIKAYAISSSFSLGYVKKLLMASNEISADTKTILSDVMSGIMRQSVSSLSDETISRILVSFIMAQYGFGLTSAQMDSISSYYEDIYNTSLNSIPVLPMDGFLECEVQSAIGYNHFSVYNRCFGYESDMTKRSQGSWEIPHNLEAQDDDIIKFIIGEIGQTQFYYTEESGNTIKIDTIISLNNDTSITIPSTIDGKTVTKIGQNAASGNFHRANDSLYQVNTISIPSTVTEIGFGAFQNCSNLTSVTFAPNSQLTTIYAYAFDGCTSLTSIDLPDSVTTIHEYAFADTGLTSCNLKNVSTLGYGVFADCHSLTSFSKNSGNSSLAIGDSKVVYGSSSTQLLAYACGNTGTSFTIPNTVTIIGESAFKGASNLTSVTFSTSLAEVRFSSFENCTGLTNVELPGTVTDIGAFAFSGCYNLSSVRMFSTGNIAIGMGAFTGTDSVSFTVPQARISYYQSTEGLSPYASDVTAITYQISYVPYNGQTIAPTTVYYGVVPTIFNKNNLDPRVGYAVDGWYLSTENGNGTGTAFNASALYMTQGDTVLYARWVEMSPGNITYNANSNDATGTMTNGNVAYGGSYTISVCGFNLPGYECSGWATSANGIIEYNSGTEYTFYLTEGLTLYAVWTPVVYSIGYQLNNATGGVGNLRDYYTVENHYSFPAVSRTGYVFYGWVLVGNIDGMVLQNTVGFMQDITVRAEWEQTYQMGSSSPTTISATAVVLDFSGYSSGTSVNKEFTITRTVDSITLANILNLKNLNFNINNSRGCRTKVIFDNVDFTGRASYPAIEAISVDIDIYVKSNSYVRGGSSTISNHEITLEELVYMPSAATFKHMRIFKHPESTYTKPYIAFYGGNGIDGTAGGNGSNNGNNTAGTNGGNGTDGCQGITALFGMGLYVGDNVKVYAYGGNGGKGGDGGRGGDAGNTTTSVGYGQVGVTGQYGGNAGNGGNGGHANHAVWILGSCTFSSDSYVYFRAGNGGAGGKGGNGGTGGKGGKGGDGKLGVHAARGGTGGDGGFGGNGGKGGNVCSSALVCINQTGSCYNLGGTVGSGGSGGSGGAGGAGGRGGKKWPTNNYAETGYTGDVGYSGATGSSGSSS